MSKSGSKLPVSFVRPKGIMSMERLLGARCFGGDANGGPLWPAPSALVKSFSQDLVEKCYEPPSGLETWREVPKFYSLRKSSQKPPARAAPPEVPGALPSTRLSTKMPCATLPGGANDAPVEEIQPSANECFGIPSLISDSPRVAPGSTTAQQPCEASSASPTAATEAPRLQQLPEPGTGSQCPKEAAEHTDERASEHQVEAPSSVPVRETAAPPPPEAPLLPPAAAAAVVPPPPHRWSKRTQHNRDLVQPGATEPSPNGDPGAQGPSTSPTPEQQRPRKSRRVNDQSREEMLIGADAEAATAGDMARGKPAAVTPPPPPAAAADPPPAAAAAAVTPPPPPAAAAAAPPPPPPPPAAAAAAAAPALSQSAERHRKAEPEHHSRDESPKQEAASSTPLMTVQPEEQGERAANLFSDAAGCDVSMDEAEEGELPQQPQDPKGGNYLDAPAALASAQKALPSAASRLLALACTEDQTTWGLLGQRSIITRSHLRAPSTQQGAAAADNQGGGGGEERGAEASCLSKGQAQRDRQAVRARIRTWGSVEGDGGALEEEGEEEEDNEEEREVGLAVEIKKFAKRAARARHQSHKGGVQKVNGKKRQLGGRAADQTHRGFRGAAGRGPGGQAGGRGRGAAAGRGRGRGQQHQHQQPRQSSQQRHQQAGDGRGVPPGAAAAAPPSRKLAPMPEPRQWDRDRSGEYGRQWDDGFSSGSDDRDDEGPGGARQPWGLVAEADVYASNPLLEEEEKASNSNNKEAGRGGADAAPSSVQNNSEPLANEVGGLGPSLVPPLVVHWPPGGAEQDGLCVSPANSLLPALPSWK